MNIARQSARHIKEVLGATLVGRWLRSAGASSRRATEPFLVMPEVTSQAPQIAEPTPALEELTLPIPRSPTNGNIHVDIHVIDKCNLLCPTCFRGTGAQKNTSTTMPLPKFREIIDRVRLEGYPNVALINWTEPFLNKRLSEYVAIVKEAGLDCWLSSNLSLPPDAYLPTILSALAAGVDFMGVSVSGFTQPIYEINHKRGRVDWVKANLEAISKELWARRIKTGVWIRYLEFPHNSHEKSAWQEYIKLMGIGFDPIQAHGDPNDPLPDQMSFRQDASSRIQAFETSDDLRASASAEEGRVPEMVCTLVADRLALDAKGDAYLCCAFPNSEELKLGPYIEIKEDELLLRRHTHPYCKTCKIPRREVTDADRVRFARAWQARLNRHDEDPLREAAESTA